MDFLENLEAEIASQERILASHPAYIKLKALREIREIYVEPSKPVMRISRPPSYIEDRRPAPLSGKSLDAVAAVIDILRENGSPIRTTQLMPLIMARGIFFSGSAPQNVLSSLLSRSPEIVSKGGHIGWALKEWESAGSESSGEGAPPAEEVTRAQGREAGPGGGT